MSARVRVAALSLGLVCGLLACSPAIKVRSDYNRAVDFSKLRSFAWLPVPPPQTGDRRADSSLLAGRVRRSVVADLDAKGFREVRPDDRPDFYVTYQAAVDQRIDVRSVPTYYGYRGWWGAPMVPMGSQTSVRQYELGTLVLDVIDAERDDLIWRGSGQAKLGTSRARSSAERDQAVADAVQQILADFPPVPAS